VNKSLFAIQAGFSGFPRAYYVKMGGEGLKIRYNCWG